MDKYQIEALAASAISKISIIRAMAELYKEDTGIHIQDAIRWAQAHYTEMPITPADLCQSRSLKICTVCNSERGNRPFCLHCYKQHFQAAQDAVGESSSRHQWRKDMAKFLAPLLECEEGAVEDYLRPFPTD